MNENIYMPVLIILIAVIFYYLILRVAGGQGRWRSAIYETRLFLVTIIVGTALALLTGFHIIAVYILIPAMLLNAVAVTVLGRRLA